MRSIAGFIIRTSSFVSKELIEILRQTRLLLALVLGPFLILLLFGIGYRNEARPLRTLFVVPPGQAGIRQQVQEYGTTLGPQIDFRGIVEDQGTAFAQLAANQVDAVIVIPSNIEQSIRSSQQPVIKLYHREIDPAQVSYVDYVGQIYIGELNRRVLRNIAEQAQKEAGAIEGDLQTAKASAHAMRLAFESGNANEAQNQRLKMTQSLEAVSLGVGASLGVLQGVEQTMGPNQGSGEAGPATQILQTLQAINSNNQALENTQTNQSNYTEEGQRAAKIEQDLNQLDSQLNDFRQIDPTVLVSPFQAQTVSINNIKLTESSFFAPAVVALLLQHLLVTFAALSLVRERTSGTMELFRVAPITAFETLLGKYLSYMVIAVVLAALITVLVVFVLGVPLLGDWRNYALVLLALMFAAMGIGFVISLISETTSQAVQFSMLVLLFSIFFSGFFLDLRLMAQGIRFLAYLIPVTYAMQMLQDIMFRANQITPLLMTGLLGYGVVLFIVSWFLLSKEMRLR